MSRRRQCFTGLAFLFLTCAAAGCGGSSSPVPPPPGPPPKFSAASLSGQYAFLMSGTEECSGQGSFFTRVGSFTADGAGRITAGLEDINVCTGVETLDFTGGSYSIGDDGRGGLSLINSTGTTTYSIALSTGTHGTIIQTDVGATASGTFQRQTPSAFSTAAIQGGYVFNAKGVEVSGTTVNPISIIGRFDANGGGVTNGLFDSNIAGVPSGQQVLPAGALYAVDPNSDGTNFGRGTASLAGDNYVFYVVDSTHISLLGVDFPSALSGEAFAQQAIAFNVASLAGSYAFLIGGSSTSGSIATGGRFTADGGGNITNVLLDENDSGRITQLPVGSVTGSYTVDANQFGGGSLTLADSTAGTFTFIFYLISPTQAIFQETDTSITSDGTFAAQTSTPITTASLAGDYEFGWSGTNPEEQDYAGQLTVTSGTGNFTGLVDLNDFATGKQTFDASVSGNLVLAGDGTGANGLTANVGTSPATTLQFTSYVVDPNTVLMVGIDTNSVLAGTLVRQP
jgi:hypothetical protein